MDPTILDTTEEIVFEVSRYWEDTFPQHHGILGSLGPTVVRSLVAGIYFVIVFLEKVPSVGRTTMG